MELQAILELLDSPEHPALLGRMECPAARAPLLYSPLRHDTYQNLTVSTKATVSCFVCRCTWHRNPWRSGFRVPVPELNAPTSGLVSIEHLHEKTTQCRV